MAKAPYKTKQMTEILTFLKSVQGRHVTVNEICDFFREKGISVGTTTYHCKCEKCGKLIHLQCNEIESLKQHMQQHHDFQMDPHRTVFYGICGECSKKE